MSSPEPRAWHAMSDREVLAELRVSDTEGLSDAEGAARLAAVGPNALPTAPPRSAVLAMLSQLADPLVGALLVAAVIAAVVAATGPADEPWLLRYGDTGAILLIVILNAVLGFVQERRAESALEALRKLSAPSARRRRGGRMSMVPAVDLVPGDIVELEAGDAVPADLRLLDTRETTIDESTLTGESVPVLKRAEGVLAPSTVLAERANLASMGTTVVRGHARGVVVRTASDTEVGRIGAMIRDAERAPTPLEIRLARLGRIILAACLLISALLFVIGLARGGQSWTVLLLTAVSLAVAAIPEGLPAITTITLALGTQRMAARGAIVRRLPAVETLGSATIICSDKTGTLTKNEMTVRFVDTLAHDVEVPAEGHGEPLDPPPDVRALLETAVLCNHATLDDGEATGDPTEVALLRAGLRAGVSREALLADDAIERELPFDSTRKRMTVIIRGDGGARVAHVKGAPDRVLSLCDRVLDGEASVELGDALRARLHERAEAHARRGLRVLALARRQDPSDDDPESGLTLLGFAAMVDPPREGVAEAVAACDGAGIRVVMITGDHVLTARAIATELGIAREGSRAVTGAELAEMDDEALDAVIDEVAVFARVTPEQKLRLVRCLQRRGHVAAMTGDGVNDAPALKEARIGVAMGRAGTDVAREAGDLVLADDDFATIVAAVREGRAIFSNIRKFIFFLNSSNAGLCIAVIVGSFFDWPPLTPLQLLWINLVTNGLPALALGVDPAEPGQMQRPPRPVGSGIVGARDALGVVFVGSVMAGAALVLHTAPEVWPALFPDQTTAEAHLTARTMAFTLLALSPLFHAFNARSPYASILELGFFANGKLWLAIAISAGVHMLAVLVEPLHPLFRTTAMTGEQWALVVALAVLPLPAVEIMKRVERRVRPDAVRAATG